MKISIIIPVLNESSRIVSILEDLQGLRLHGNEVLVVDGGSSDATAALCQGLADEILVSNTGRALQMNTGAQKANGDVLLFLHVDTRLPHNVCEEIIRAIDSGKSWGRFDVRLSGSHRMFRIVEWFMNTRSRLTGVATGDQVLFVGNKLFKAIGGYPALSLMEDIAICKMLRRISRPACIRSRVITSSRRWEQYGIMKTILLMWRLRLAYFLGADTSRLHALYHRTSG